MEEGSGYFAEETPSLQSITTAFLPIHNEYTCCTLSALVTSRHTMASVMQVEHESTNSIKRSTKEGRQLTYELVVLQQPERARACGSGAKCWSIN